MKVAEENFKIVYTLTRAEIIALFRYYIHYVRPVEQPFESSKPIYVVHKDDDPGSNRTGGHVLEGFKLVSMMTDETGGAVFHGTIDAAAFTFPSKAVRYVDVLWPGGARLIRYYNQDHPKSAEVVRTARPVDKNPEWIDKYS